MPLILTCRHASIPDQLTVRPGQKARVGRSQWMEMCVPDDTELLDTHFTIDGFNGWQLSVCQPAIVVCDGQAVTAVELVHGHQFQAGSTLFQVALTANCNDRCGENMRALVRTEIENPSRAGQPLLWFNKPSLQRIGLTSESLNVLENLAPGDWRLAVRQLASKGNVVDALRTVASIMTHRQAISWCKACSDLGGTAANFDNEAKSKVVDWLEHSIEAKRIACAELLVNRNLDQPADWMLQAISWTGGSLSPKDAPHVVPPTELPAIAVVAALQLIAAAGEFQRLCAGFIQLGCDMLASGDELDHT